ncbi:MAG: hypothetical protein IJ829_07445, partial [Kiritimatiellae bacterium]|nr:hypothetical protein [Kiritimatiellia bacterium]
MAVEAAPAALKDIAGCRLASVEGDVLGCSRFRGMTARIEERTDERGGVTKALSVKGLGDGILAKPGNWADGAVLVSELWRVAERNGAVLDFGSVEAATEAAGLLAKVEGEGGLKKARAKLETRAKLFDLLARTALDTGVTFDEASFRKALAETGNGRKYIDRHGDIYGFKSADGTLHFNPTQLDYNIPIHEYGHLALEALKGVNRRLWERGMELVKGSDYYRAIKEQSETAGHEYEYLRGDEAGICDEALATLIGDRGERIVEAEGVGAELKAWLKDFWKAFKGAFGLADMADEQIERMTLGEFVDAVNAELLRGREFGTRKAVPLAKKSIKRYDEAQGSGSNGVLRWTRDRGRLFHIPVDRERTQPGEKVVFAQDDAEITDWIQRRLNGYELRMSKGGSIYVKGRNGFDGELAEIFGRYPKAGQNDGLGEELASVLANEGLREAAPDDLVGMLLKDRANYDEWAKATEGGRRSLDDVRAERHAAEEAEREEAEARRRWEESGMDVPEYVLSRIEDGEAGIDLDWETMREMAHDAAEGKFAVRQEEYDRWNKLLDAYERGELRPESQMTVFEHTPAVLRKLGSSDHPVTLGKDVLDKIVGIVKTESGGRHDIPVSELRNLQIELDNPIAVFDSKTQSNAKVVLTRIVDRQNNERAVVALHLDRERETIRVNKIASAYGKDPAKMEQWVKGGLLRYVNKQARDSSPVWVQFPPDSEFRARSILTEKDFSDEELGRIVPQSVGAAQGGGARFSVAQTTTPQFKRWFGDWENDPANASKVVDEDGRPLVVWHGTDVAFNVFDAEYGAWFSDSREQADFYQKGFKNESPRTMAVYLNIRNPRIIDAKGHGWDDIPVPTDIREAVGDRFATSDTLAAFAHHDKAHDGLIIKNVLEQDGSRPTTDFVVYKSEQVKSATDNTGAFSPTNPDIRFAAGRGASEVGGWVIGAGGTLARRGTPQACPSSSQA